MPVMGKGPEINKSALIIVDMQNDFLHRDGNFSHIAREHPEAQIDLPFLIGTIPNVKRLADAFRTAGRPGRWRNASARNWPIYKSKSMKRRVESWILTAAKASVSSASTSAASFSVAASPRVAEEEVVCGLVACSL